MNRREVKCRWLVLVLVLVLALCFAGEAGACPTCKDSLLHSQDQANMVRGYFWSILFMMSMPFLILAGLGGYFYYLVRKAQAAPAAWDRVDPAAGGDLPGAGLGENEELAGAPVPV